MDANSVLLVEDEVFVLLDLEASLIEAGFEVFGSWSGDEALKAFDREPARFNAVVTDIRLGNGPSGWDIARHVREARSTIPVVYMSGDSSVDWQANGVLGSVMIRKPFGIGQVVTALATLLYKPPSELLIA
jgi:two-component system OmpR family response regulator